MKDKLEELRKQIDSADEELLNALAKRFDIVQKIGDLKKEHGIEPLDEDRFKALLNEKLKRAEQLGLSPEFVETIYNAIHQESLKIERKK